MVQGDKASVSILDGSVLAGKIPGGKLRLVQAWIEIHREDLLADWEIAISGGELDFPLTRGILNPCRITVHKLLDALSRLKNN